MRIGAIDAGSNAVRLAIADVDRRGGVTVIARRRAAVRLGHRVFRDGVVGRKRTAAAARAFRKFARLLDEHEVGWLRAVATSALRNARDRRFVLGAIREHSDIDVEIITGDQEAALVRSVVLDAFPDGEPPTVIADLGGGSLEVSVLDRVARRRAHAVLPLGTVRLLHEHGLSGQFSKHHARQVRDHVATSLASALGEPPTHVRRVAICGGNARALAKLTPGTGYAGLPTVDLAHLAARFHRMRKRDVRGRMRAYGVRKDRADVLPIAAIVFRCVGRWLGARELVAPGVGLADGLLRDMAAAAADERVSA